MCAGVLHSNFFLFTVALLIVGYVIYTEFGIQCWIRRYHNLRLLSSRYNRLTNIWTFRYECTDCHGVHHYAIEGAYREVARW